MLRYKGNWSYGVDYDIGSVVVYTDNQVYHKQKPCPNYEPPTDTRYWELVDQTLSQVVILFADYLSKDGRKPGTVIGAYSSAFGYDTEASGSYSFAEGNETIASGDASHAEGMSTGNEDGETKATEFAAHAEGIGTTASGVASHSEGYATIASGSYSHAGGYNTVASKMAMTAIGKYNATPATGELFVVGNGTDSERHNAFAVHADNSITIGDTTLTEAQLQDLLGLMTPQEGL